MIGIGAMAVISNLTGNTQEAQNYTSIANTYISQWLTFGIAYNDNPPHTTLAYEQGNTHGMSWGVADFPWCHKLIMSTQVCYTTSSLTLNWIWILCLNPCMTCRVISTLLSRAPMEFHLRQGMTTLKVSLPKNPLRFNTHKNESTYTFWI